MLRKDIMKLFKKSSGSIYEILSAKKFWRSAKKYNTKCAHGYIASDLLISSELSVADTDTETSEVGSDRTDDDEMPPESPRGDGNYGGDAAHCRQP